MCGVFGIISNTNVTMKMLAALKSLEYRGYDSAGIAGIENGALFTVKVAGKVKNLEDALSNSTHQTNIGIAHTRWATHGIASHKNAHPHSGSKVAIVHNGIVENNDELRSGLHPTLFTSETDSETIMHLIELSLNSGHTPLQSIRLATAQLKGSFAILAIFADYPGTLIAAKKHSPLAIGWGVKQICVSSDVYALAQFSDYVAYLKDGDIASIKGDEVELFDANDERVERVKSKLDIHQSSKEKGNFSHYMQKEIFEQPSAVKQALSQYVSSNELEIQNIQIDFKAASQIYILACGTSYFAGLIAKFWLEDIAKITTHVEIASEFCTKTLPPPPNSIGIFISQSGETADTYKALEIFKKFWVKSVAIVNVEESTIAKNVDIVLPIYAGQEIGVASTKAFTNQLVVLACLGLKAALDRKSITHQEAEAHIQSLFKVPGRIAELLSKDEEFKNIAKSIMHSKSILYIGRGVSYALALEGALKLKEISYIHAEAVAAGELKHGHIALIDRNMYVVAIMPEDRTFAKCLSNVRAATSRHAKLILLTTPNGIQLLLKDLPHIDSISITQASDFITPFLYIVPLQLISYHAGVLRGNDVDQPRNLAKAVTVE